MSLLATEGTGVFSKQHFIAEASGTCVKIPKSLATHQMIWVALEHWADLRRSTNLLADIIITNNIPLKDWIDSFGAGSQLRPIGSRWLKAWGLDLERLSEDHEARNESSYRPTRLSPLLSFDAITSSNFLRNLWAVYEPSGSSRFELLDRHLLRLSLEEAFQAITGTRVKDNPNEFERRIDVMLSKILLTEPSGLRWKKFLMRVSEPNNPKLIDEAKGKADIGDSNHHIQVMARAALLLRVATGACAMLLKETGSTRTDLEFWWKSLGKDIGLWEPGNEPLDLTDLWAEIKTALEQTEKWDVTKKGTKPSFATWQREQLQVISVLGQCERIALWGLGL